MGNKSVVFSRTAREAREFFCGSSSNCNWGIPWV